MIKCTLPNIYFNFENYRDIIFKTNRRNNYLYLLIINYLLYFNNLTKFIDC